MSKAKTNDWTDVLFEEKNPSSDLGASYVSTVDSANDGQENNDKEFWADISNVHADDIIEAAIRKKKQRDLAKQKSKQASITTQTTPIKVQSPINNDLNVQQAKRSPSKKNVAKKLFAKKPFHYEEEVDSAVLHRRQKQIDYGKNTLGYQNYVANVPKPNRTRDQPKTPRKHVKYSRRSWDMQIKLWRIKLHTFDPTPQMMGIQQNEITMLNETNVDINISPEDASELFDSAYSEALSEGQPMILAE